MFRPEQVGKVNRDAVGGYPAGTLLVVWADEVKHRAVPWTRVAHADGRHYPVVDRAGSPLFEATDVTADQLRAARVIEEEPEADPPHVVE